ncbi:hypothetical protein BDV32DRAFT_32678 [Aspergillus pseudonomiae]|uniref:Uncharacterized protein n=1 Tax=Aspergillus pseudonomiae TaxID=1506151 RepID=A0A5N6I5J1_9EURO|nr:uncharacterized protein BDV37DRAFT_46377 [Aspergillus pseudonomiae]KAB8261638.1 hypothetical protein BDV32DRAFT_32678 [Aspergillus pseudonomiae]KAE8406871.1 hypothetical protein BDV37DRAFT_46377 [Aspergillus pseudonomiae]
MSTLLPAKSLLIALGVVGVLGTWGRTALDGSTELLTKVLDDPNGQLPGTQVPLQRTFTGIRIPIDHIISTLVVFWYEVVDGSHPSSTAVALYFLGQLLPCLVIAYTNAQRGSKSSLVRPTLWLTLFQVCSLGVTGWIWALSYITSAPTVPKSKVSAVGSFDLLQRASRVSSPALVKQLLVPAIILGYLVPAALMGVFSSNPASTAHQSAIGAWNMYPLLILPMLYILRSIFSPAVATTGPRAHLHAIRAANIPTLIISVALHWSVLGVSLSTILFPSIFTPAYREELHPSAVFVPPLALSPATTPGDGVKGFLLWDELIAYLVVLVVVALELQGAWSTIPSRGGAFRWSWFLPAAFGASLLLGPGTMCLLISWLRDEILFGEWVDRKEGTKAAE